MRRRPPFCGRWRRAGALVWLPVVLLLLIPASAAAGGRYCERLDDLCWSCADIEFPAELPCATPDVCGEGRLCVIQTDGDTCFTPFTTCCDTDPCETAPGCPTAARACSDVEGDGRTDNCTFLSDCPDAGVSMPIDAGAVAMDGGPPPLDAGTPSRDAGQPPGDAGAGIDARARLVDGLTELDFRGGGGCGCHAAGRTLPVGGRWAHLLLLAVGLIGTGRRR